MEYITQNWDNNSYKKFFHELTSHADEKYRVFNERLMPGEGKTLGIRVPLLRDIGKQVAKGDFRSFLSAPKNSFHEEILLEGLVIGYAKMEPSEFLKNMYSYAQKISNWALCDVAVSTWKIIGRHREFFWPAMVQMTKEKNPWIQRVGIIAMLDYYLTVQWINNVFDIIKNPQSDDYYVQMAISWLLATAFAKLRENTYTFISSVHLDKKILKMTAQKMRDSRRITQPDKDWITAYANGKR